MKKFTTLFAAALLAPTMGLAAPQQQPNPERLQTLMHPDHRVHNFQHMDEVFPAVSIKGSSKPSHFKSNPAPLPTEYEYKGETRQLDEFLQRTVTTGLMVLKKGEVKAEQYFQGAKADATFTSWSVGKSVVSTLISVALKEGHINSLNDKVNQYVPELRGKAYGDASIKDVLRMATGVEFNEDYHDKASDINQWMADIFRNKNDAYAYIAERPKAEEPGTRFHYISPNSQILMWVLTRATGESLQDLVATRLWEPLGMSDGSFWNTDTQGNELGFCCLNTTVENYAKLGQLYLQQGEWNGKQLLSDNWVTEATKRKEDWLQAGHSYAERGYGYHIWVPENPQNEYFFNGVWGQTVWVNEDADTVIVKTSVDPNFSNHTAEMIAVMRAITAHYQQ